MKIKPVSPPQNVPFFKGYTGLFDVRKKKKEEGFGEILEKVLKVKKGER